MLHWVRISIHAYLCALLNSAGMTEANIGQPGSCPLFSKASSNPEREGGSELGAVAVPHICVSGDCTPVSKMGWVFFLRVFIFKAYTNKDIYLLVLIFTFASHLWSESLSLLKVLHCFTRSGEGYSTWPAICRVTACSLTPARHWPGPRQYTSTWSSLWLTQFRARKRRHFPTSCCIIWHARCSSAELSKAPWNRSHLTICSRDTFPLARASQVLSHPRWMQSLRKKFQENMNTGCFTEYWLRNFSHTSLLHTVYKWLFSTFFRPMPVK